MKVTVNDVEIKLSADYEEYLALLRKAVVKPGEPPIESDAEMVKRLLLDNYAANIQQHAALRPKSVSDKMALIEKAAVAVFQEAVKKAEE